MRRILKVLLVSVTLLCSVAGFVESADKSRNWQNGTWRESDRRQVYVRGVVLTYEQFVIDTPDYEYAVEIGIRPKKRLPMTVNTPVRFAVEKGDVFVIGEDGKEYKLELTKKTLKTTPIR